MAPEAHPHHRDFTGTEQAGTGVTPVPSREFHQLVEDHPLLGPGSPLVLVRQPVRHSTSSTHRTLLCGDLFTHLGNGPAITEDDIVTPAMDAEALFRSASLTPDTAAVIRALGDLEPLTLALMHGSSFSGNGERAQYGLAGAYEAQYLA